MQYVEEAKREGIDVYRFVIPKAVFLNYTANPANKGFCTTGSGCLHSGLLDVENCRDGKTILVPLPQRESKVVHLRVPFDRLSFSVASFLDCQF